MDHTDTLKKQYRQKLYQIKSRLLPKHVAQTLSLEPIFTNAKHIGCFKPIQPEIDIVHLYDILTHNGAHCYLPVASQNHRLQFTKWHPGEPLRLQNQCWVPETLELIEASSLELIIVPCIGIDSSNKRLGRGGGWYDRTIDSKMLTTAIIDQAQVIPEVITKSHDLQIKHIYKV